MKLTAYGKTDVGLLRSNNEDNLFLDELHGLFIVADGMGGHAAGEIASEIAIEVVREQLEPQLAEQASTEQWQSLLADAINAANLSIAQAGAENKAWSGMGTTLTILLIDNRQAFLAHVGDSRLYRWRNQQLEQLSNDHTLVADQLRRGIINEQEACQSNLGNVLLQAVGISEELEICQDNLVVQADDCFLLCSDGLTGMLADEEISAILTDNCLPVQACEELITAALAAGGKDNVTAVLVTATDK